tara:strand:+ start:1210 stop:1485 length:276 start_codon:yes stop_codon:yes gene_type:complete
MNTKSGTPARIVTPVISLILWRNTKRRFYLKRNIPNINAVDISANAIGKPRKMSVSKTGNIHITMSVILLRFSKKIRDRMRLPVLMTSAIN